LPKPYKDNPICCACEKLITKLTGSVYFKSGGVEVEYHPDCKPTYDVIVKDLMKAKKEKI